MLDLGLSFLRWMSSDTYGFSYLATATRPNWCGSNEQTPVLSPSLKLGGGAYGRSIISFSCTLETCSHSWSSWTMTDVSPRTVAQLLAILTSEDDCTTLRLELAAIIDVGQHLVTLTYNLEGDGPLVFSTHELLQKAATAFSQANWSNVKSMPGEWSKK